VPIPEPGVAARLAALHERIAAAARACGRDPGGIGLVAVSKRHPAEAVEAAYAAGQRAFGENYPQEAIEKISRLALPDIEWHFIGRIQSNKTRPIAEHFAWVHGLADLRHAERLADQRPAELPPLHLCLQVNLTGEASKGGVSEADLPALARAAAGLPRLRLRGLMTMTDPAAPPAAQRATFRRLRLLKERLSAQGLDLDTLSMGMSDDLEAAIAEGATLVRVGTAVFGPRA
jgi:pyridoxal phosphate enzyme (YggS family)